MEIKQHPDIPIMFESLPSFAQEKLKVLRELIVETASEIPHIKSIEETLKWGEMSYLVKKGSTIRINWSPKTPERYGMYFICSTNLVETFKFQYGDLFNYDKNRAIIFSMDDAIPSIELKECIALALCYHDQKKLS